VNFLLRFDIQLHFFLRGFHLRKVLHCLEVGTLEAFLRGGPEEGVEGEHALHEFEALWVYVREYLFEVLRLSLRELLDVRDCEPIRNKLEVVVVRRPYQLEDRVQQVALRLRKAVLLPDHAFWRQREAALRLEELELVLAGQLVVLALFLAHTEVFKQFEDYDAGGPNVHSRMVVFFQKDYLGRPVRSRRNVVREAPLDGLHVLLVLLDDFVGLARAAQAFERFEGQLVFASKDFLVLLGEVGQVFLERGFQRLAWVYDVVCLSRQAEVAYFGSAVLRQKNIRRLQISMQNASTVQKVQSTQNVVDDGLNLKL